MNYLIQIEGEEFELDSTKLEATDILKLEDKKFHVLHDNQNFEAKIIAFSNADKTATIEVDGEKFEIKIEDEYDQLVKKMGLSIGGGKKLKNIKAPMPGLVLEILIEPGQAIAKGDQLLILEAMKMENVLKAAGDGVVKSIEIEKGNTVEKGQILIEME